MLSALESLVTFVAAIGDWIVWSIETAWNLLEGLFQTAVNGVLAALPAFPEAVAPPTVIKYVNWFFPVGYVLTLVTTMTGLFVAFFAVRWLLQKSGIVN